MGITSILKRILCWAVLVLVVLAGISAPKGPTLAADTIIHNFAGVGFGDGASPAEGNALILSGSTFYGMTRTGGTSNAGTVFSMSTDGSNYAVLRSFAGGASDGSLPAGYLVQSGSILYGMTLTGGTSDFGTLFYINTDGSNFTLLHSFRGGSSDGSSPVGSLILSGSTLYGMTLIGGTSNLGTLFSINTDGTSFTIIRSFAGGSGDGQGGRGALLLIGSTFYGLTRTGGSQNKGIIFSMNTNGSNFTILHTFIGSSSVDDGVAPNGVLVHSGGVLYGLASGGSTNKGTVFSIKTDGTDYKILRMFGGTTDGNFPQGSLVLSGLTLYGTTQNGGSLGNGTIFSINTDGSNFTVIHAFAGGSNDGANPNGSLAIVGATLYGMTSGGGNGGGGSGTIFSVLIPPPPGSSSGTPTKGTITVKNTTLGGNSVFNFTTTGSGYVSFIINTSNGFGNNTQSVSTGTYSASETVPDGWTKTQDTCSNLSVVVGQDTSCSVTNARNGFIQVKMTTTGGDTTVAFTATGGGYANFKITSSSGAGSNLQSNTPPGTYSAVAAVPDGWTKTQDTCSSITVPPGQTAICLVALEKKPPPPPLKPIPNPEPTPALPSSHQETSNPSSQVINPTPSSEGSKEYGEANTKNTASKEQSQPFKNIQNGINTVFRDMGLAVTRIFNMIRKFIPGQ